MPTIVSNNKAPEPVGFEHYLDIVRRRRLFFVIPFFAAWLMVWGASWLIPPRYKSGTLILVEQPTMPKDYVLPNVAENLQERLQSITQQILSRSRLLHIADELNLYPKDRSRVSPDDIVERMRKNVDIELVRGVDNQISAFNVYYTADDPTVAQRVTNKLTNLFINENLEARQQESEGNTKFLENQLAAARQNLENQEQQIRQFKGQYVGQLPSQLNSNLQILGGLQSQLQTQSEALNATKQQRVYLETLLNQYHVLKGSSKTSGGSQTSVADLEDQIDRLKSQLRELSSTYNDQYPEVRRLKDEIAKAESQRDQLVAEQKRKGNNPQADASTVAAAQGNGLRDPAALAQLQSQLQASQTETNNREQAIASITAQIANYQARLNDEPIREQQLADLTRGYDQSKASYDDLLKKKNDSAMATSMELLQQGERFRILDPPSLPFKPSFPDRLKFCGMGLIAGLIVGAGFVSAVEAMDDRVYSETELRKLLPVSVLSELPVISDPADDRHRHTPSRIGWATSATVLFTILAGSALRYFMG